jgi:polar amino acid transport system substrate-binding protein
MRSGEIDTYATNKPILYELADRLTGAKILDGNWGVEHLAIGIPKGREPGLDFIRAFSDEAKARGLVKRAVQRAGMRGVAP